MTKEGLTPQLFAGSGHIHIEVSKLDPVTVRNFLVDFWNHTGLSAGALNDDVYNSIGIGELPEKNKQSLRDIVNAFDAQSGASIETLVNGIESSVYDVSLNDELEEYRKSGRGTRPGKYHAISFRSFFNQGTVEIRSLRPQQNAASYRKMLTLFVKRLEFADAQAKQGIRVPVGAMPSLRGNPQEVLKNFHKYVSEVGLNIEDYKEFIMPWWQNAGGEWDQFTGRLRFAKLPTNCSSMLSFILNAKPPMNF